jgi:cobalt-zinc-cadmium efflux system membrane fusion protein
MNALRKLALLSILALVDCKREAPPASTSPERKAAPVASGSAPADAKHEELSRKVRLSEQVIRDAKLRVTPVTREVLSETLTLAGEVAADPDHLARISSPSAGRIEQVRFKEGQNVKKGDVLVVLRVPEIGKVRSALVATRSRAAAARVNAERLNDLLAKRLASQQEALNAKSEADALEVEAGSLEEQLSALGAGASGAFAISLRAPISGTVLARDAVVGQPVSSEQVLGSVAELDEVWFLGRVFEKDLGRLVLGAAAEIRLNAYPSERFVGRVEYVGQQVDAAARSVTARVRLSNRAGLLRIGLFGTAEIAVSGATPDVPRLVVARSAVTEIADQSVVFVREQSGDFVLHEVTLGRAAPGKVEILAGLREGEPVVTDGVFTLKSVVLKGSFAEEEQ